MSVIDNPNHSKFIREENGLKLYLTPSGLRFWLDETRPTDQVIKMRGEYEPTTTAAVKKILKEGDVVIDVGANIGYFTVLFNHLVGNSGCVIAFEPTQFYSQFLRKNLRANNFSDNNVYEIGLSNKTQTAEINRGLMSATLHWVGDVDPSGREHISLMPLDDFFNEQPAPEKIDFIKVDIDGHEPLFFEGARNTLQQFDPVVLLEISHPHYLKAGIDTADFYDYLTGQGYSIYTEDSFRTLESKEDYINLCVHFTHSVNVIISKKPLKLREYHEA